MADQNPQSTPNPPAPQAPGPEGPPMVEVRPGAATSTEGEYVRHPAKLLRIASMVRELLEEVRQSPLDETGRQHFTDVHTRTVNELKEVLSEDLQKELDHLTIPFDGTPSVDQLRIAQAQLVGWLEGLFHGIQAALWSQHMQARAQLEEMRRRSLPPGAQGPPEGGGDPGTLGQYL